MTNPAAKYRVRLPIWKAYLYNLITRIKMYRWINMGLITFGLTQREGTLINHMLMAYGIGDERHRPRAHKFNAIVHAVYTNLGIATKEEIAIADKLFNVTKLKTEDLIMEMKKLKRFAKDVGLKLSQYKDLGEDDLVKLILANVDAAVEYPEDFGKWYGSLPDELFDEVESEPGEDDGKNTGSSDKADAGEADETGPDEISEEEIIEILEDDATTMDELKELIDEVSMFNGVSTKGIKDVDALKEKLMTIVENGGESDDDDESGDDGGDGFDPDELAELKEEISGMKSKDDLIECLGDYEEVFGDEIDPDEFKLALKLRKAMVAHVDALIEQGDESNDDESGDESGDDDPGIDVDAEYEKYKGLNIVKLRKAVNEADIDIETKGRKKDEILEDVMTWLTALAEGDEPRDEKEPESGELEINEALINEAEEAEDTDTLNAIADELGVTFNALDKRSAKRMAIRLRKNLPEDAEDSSKAAKGKDKGKAKSNKKAETKAGSDSTPEERVSLFKEIESMMADGKTEEDIVDAVKPRLKKRGVNLKTAKTKVRAYMQVIEIEQAKEKK